MTTLLPVNAVHFGYLSLLPQWLLVKYMMFNFIHHKDLFGVTFRLFLKKKLDEFEYGGIVFC